VTLYCSEIRCVGETSCETTCRELSGYESGLERFADNDAGNRVRMDPPIVGCLPGGEPESKKRSVLVPRESVR